MKIICFTLIAIMATAVLTFRLSSRVGYNTAASVLSYANPSGNAALTVNSMMPGRDEKDSDMQFGLGKIAFSLLPLSPESVGKRKTILTEIVKDQIWTLDQIQGIINVNVPVRSTVIRLKGGGLFVNNPVAPTAECIRMLRDLEAEYGPVKYITLASLALEHKGTVGAFSRYFPTAAVYVQPGQYSFPVDLPINFFFPLGREIKEIPANTSDAPWSTEIEHVSLGPLRPPGPGGFGDTAFYHKSTRTLLVTDSIVKVEDEPPAIIQHDPRALLYHSRDSMTEEVADTPQNRRKGWRRMVLFGLFFQPAGIDVKDTFAAIKMLDQVSPAMKKLGEGAIPFDGGLYPWEWVKSEVPNFRALQGGILVAPILQKLILNREPERVAAWVDAICEWPFTRILPSHLSNNVKATPADLRRAFNFLYEDTSKSSSSSSSSQGIFSFFKPGSGGAAAGAAPLQEDIQFLSDVSVQLTEQGVLYPEGAPVSHSTRKRSRRTVV